MDKSPADYKKLLKDKDFEPPFAYWEIDTHLAENYTDAQLLIRISGVEFVGHPGWGLVAELCKRFEKGIVNQ